jgi:hypothetical protein
MADAESHAVNWLVLCYFFSTPAASKRLAADNTQSEAATYMDATDASALTAVATNASTFTATASATFTTAATTRCASNNMFSASV